MCFWGQLLTIGDCIAVSMTPTTVEELEFSTAPHERQKI